jgi:DNA-binding XRE family transcriptional regulator
MDEGTELKIKIRTADLTIEKAANTLGITRQTLSAQINKSKLKTDFKELVFEKLNIKIGENVNTNSGHLEEKVKHLEATIIEQNKKFEAEMSELKSQFIKFMNK